MLHLLLIVAFITLLIILIVHRASISVSVISFFCLVRYLLNTSHLWLPTHLFLYLLSSLLLERWFHFVDKY